MSFLSRFFKGRPIVISIRNVEQENRIRSLDKQVDEGLVSELIMQTHQMERYCKTILMCAECHQVYSSSGGCPHCGSKSFTMGNTKEYEAARERIHDIGEQLYQLGGTDLMEATLQRVSKNRGDSGLVSAIWARIGGWMA